MHPNKLDPSIRRSPLYFIQQAYEANKALIDAAKDLNGLQTAFDTLKGDSRLSNYVGEAIRTHLEIRLDDRIRQYLQVKNTEQPRDTSRAAGIF